MANKPGDLTTTGKVGTLEEEQPKVGPEGVRRAGASESKGHREHGGGMKCSESNRMNLSDLLVLKPTPVNPFHPVL